MLENHDFSVYNGKSEDEINDLIRSNPDLSFGDKSKIADMLMDIGLLTRNVFNINFGQFAMPRINKPYPVLDMNSLFGPDSGNILDQ